MRIAAFNINNVRKRLANLLEWLTEAAPDAVCLQETKTPDGLFPRREFEQAGYGCAFKGEGAYNGVAILARGVEPIVTRRRLPGDADDRQPRYLEAAVQGVLVASIYAPNGNPQPGPKFDYKLAWMERLNAHAAELVAESVPAVLAGDFNVVPTDADIYSPRSWLKDALLQPQPRAAFRRLLDQGWTDALAVAHPGEPVWTFWDYMRQRWPQDKGLRIDHLLLSPALSPRLVTAGVDRDIRGRPNASDHAPVWVELS